LIVRLTALLFLIVLGFGIMKYLISILEVPEKRPMVEPPRFVEAKLVDYKTIIAPVKAPGRIKSVSQVELIAEAPGKILKGDVMLKKGSAFNKGDVVFTIYPDEVELALKASKSQFLNTLANLLPDISIDFPDNEKTFRKFFSTIELEKDLPTFPDINDEKLKLFLSGRNVLSEYYNIKKQELQLKRHSFVAPFAGSLTDVYLEIGSYTNTGGRVASAIQTDAMEIEVPLELFDAAWVKIGDRVSIISERRDLEWKGRVIRKSSFIDEETQSQPVFVKISNNRNSQVMAGEYLEAHFNGHPVDNVMEIPRNAVFNSNEVFLIKKGRLTKENVNIVKLNERTMLFNGLEKNDTLVIQPLIGAQEGLPAIMIGSEKAKKVMEERRKESGNKSKRTS